MPSEREARNGPMMLRGIAEVSDHNGPFRLVMRVPGIEGGVRLDTREWTVSWVSDPTSNLAARVMEILNDLWVVGEQVVGKLHVRDELLALIESEQWTRKAAIADIESAKPERRGASTYSQGVIAGIDRAIYRLQHPTESKEPGNGRVGESGECYSGMHEDCHSTVPPMTNPRVCKHCGKRIVVNDAVSPTGGHVHPWKHLDGPVVCQQTSFAEPEFAESFEALVARERQRQIAKGYTWEHDDAHGPDHLLHWALHYLKHGETVKGAALVEAAREALSRLGMGK
jgi:hypothetical protein